MKNNLYFNCLQSERYIEQFVQLKMDSIDQEYYKLEGYQEFGLEFLVSLHKYLFEGVYEERDLEIREVYSNNDRENIDKSLKWLVGYVRNNVIYPYMLERVFDTLWDLQLFFDGNTRTLYTYFSLLVKVYDLPFEIDNGDNHRFVVKKKLKK